MYLKGAVAMQYPIRLWIVAYSVVLLAITLLPASALPAGHENQPFWTEKSAFVEGDDLFVVGVATKARSVEEGRKQAFEQGKIELMNYAQITSLEAQGLVIETQMTYEEPNPDGTVTVYRLLRVPAVDEHVIRDRGKHHLLHRLETSVAGQRGGPYHRDHRFGVDYLSIDAPAREGNQARAARPGRLGGGAWCAGIGRTLDLHYRREG